MAGRLGEVGLLCALMRQAPAYASGRGVLTAAASPCSPLAEAQLGQFKGPHPVPGGQRILQALRFGGAGK